MTSSNRASATPPVLVEMDLSRKLLRVRFCGEVRPDHMKAEVDRLPARLAQLGTGFVLVTDLSELGSMDLDCATSLTRLMDLCRGAGLKRVVRIIPDPRKDIGFNLLSLFHYRGKIPIAVCETSAQAEKEIDRP